MEEIGNMVIRAVSAAGHEDRVSAFGELVRRFQDMAFGYAYTILGDFHMAEDATQNAFMTAYQRLASLEHPESFPGWLRRIVQTACDSMTRRRQLSAKPLTAASDVATRTDRPDEVAQKREMHDGILAAIAQLTDAQRQVTTLFYINGYSQKDIADFLEVPPSTVNNHLAASRKRLKERLASMVSDTLRHNAPDPEIVRDRLEFLLHFSHMLSEGQTIGTGLRVCHDRAKTAAVRDAIADITTTVLKDGKCLSDGMRKHPDLFPIPVVTLVEDGEKFGILDKTLPWACQWLNEGKYHPDPYIFQWTWVGKLVTVGLAKGAGKLLIRRNRRWRPSKDRQESGPPWAELMFADGHREPCESHMGHIAGGVYYGLKEATILDGRQEGSIQTGTLRIRPHAEDKAESFFHITFDPTTDLGVATIDLTPVGPPT